MMAAFIKDSDKKLFDIVLVWKLDRFAGIAMTVPGTRPNWSGTA